MAPQINVVSRAVGPLRERPEEVRLAEPPLQIVGKAGP